MWDVDVDLIQTFDFATGHSDQVIDNDREDRSAEVAGRYPAIQYWDPTEPKLLVCQAVLAPSSAAENAGEKESKNTSGARNEPNVS